MNAQESLRVSGGFKASHTPLPNSRWLMRKLCLVIGILHRNVLPLEVEASAVGFAPCWRISPVIGRFSCMDSPKNVRANVSTDELKALKRLARELLSYSDKTLTKAIQHGASVEVEDNG